MKYFCAYIFYFPAIAIPRLISNASSFNLVHNLIFINKIREFVKARLTSVMAVNQLSADMHHNNNLTLINHVDKYDILTKSIINPRTVSFNT